MLKRMLKTIKERKAKKVKVLIANLENKVEELIEKTEQLCVDVDKNFGKINILDTKIQYHLDNSTDDSDIIDRLDTIEYDLDGKASQDDLDDLECRLEDLENYGKPEGQKYIAQLCTDTSEHIEKVEERVEALENRHIRIKDFKVAMLSFFVKLDTTKKQKKTFNKLVEMLDSLE